MRTQESRELPVVSTAFCGSFEGIPERNVHLIGLIPPVGRPAVGHLTPPKRLHGVDQALLFIFGQQAICGPQSNAVVGSDKVQIGGASCAGGGILISQVFRCRQLPVTSVLISRGGGNEKL